MATIEQLKQALRNADAAASAGDQEAANDARQLALRIQKLKSMEHKLPEEAPIGKEARNFSHSQFAVDQFKKGAKGLMTFPFLAADASNWIAEKTGLVEEGNKVPFGTEHVGDAYDRLFHITDVPAETDYDKWSGPVYQMLGASYLPSSLTVSGAKAPLSAFTTETSSTIGGALGGKFLGDAFASYDPRLEATGQVLGEFGGGLMPLITRYGMHQGANIGQDVLDKNKQAQYARNSAKRSALDDITGFPQAQQNLEDVLDIQKMAPEFQPNLAQATDAPGLKSEASRLQARTAGDLNRAVTRQQKNYAALDDIQQQYFPEGPNVSREARKQVREVNKRLADQDAKLLDDQLKLSAKMRNKRDASEIGAELRQKRDALKTKAAAVKSKKYADVYKAADEAGLTVDVSDIKSFVNDAMTKDANAFQGPEMPSSFNQVLTEFADQPQMYNGQPAFSATGQPLMQSQEVSFEKLHSLMRKTSSEYYASKMTTNHTRTKYLKDMRDILRDKVNQFEADGYGEVAKKLRDANQYWMYEYDQKFRKGVGGLMDKTNRYGLSTPDEQIMNRIIFKKDGKQGVGEFLKLYGDDPEVMDMAKDGILDIFFKKNSSVRPDGTISKEAITSFVKSHKEALDALPEVKKIFMDADELNRQLIARRQAVHDKTVAFSKTQLSKLADISDIDGQVELALKDRNAMRGLVNSVSRIEGGKQELARVVADHIRKKSNSLQYIRENKHLKPMLDKLGEGHYDTLVAISKGDDILSRQTPPEHVARPPSERDPVFRRIGTTSRSIFSQIRAAKVHAHSSEPYILSDIGGKFAFKIQAEEADKLLDAMIHNPDLAKVMRELQKTEKITFRQANKLKTHMINLGLRSAIVTNTEE